jgi:hypothetical protein
MSELCGKLIEAMKNLGETEWYKYGPAIDDGETDPYPPVTVWRYKEKDERRDQLIVDAVESFNGNIKWAISFRDRERLPGRNWWIAPKRYKEFLDEVKDNPDIIDTKGAFAATEPEIGEAANRETPQLAEHIKKFVQAGLSVIQQ